MAKYGNSSTAFCTRCNQSAYIKIEVDEPDVSYSDRGTNYTPRRQRVTVDCGCTKPVFLDWSIDSKAKETPVAKQFDTSETKNLALNSIVSKVETLERTLFNRQEARDKIEALHTQHITDASIALDRVIAEAAQAGIEEEDFERHLPEYENELSERLTNVLNVMSLANVLEGV